MSADDLAESLRKMVPQETLDFARKLLTDHGVPVEDADDDNSLKLLGWTEATATPQVEIALSTTSACSSPTPSARRRPT